MTAPAQQAVLLYGPPASGKDTITGELVQLGHGLTHFQPLKCGSGRTAGYRMISAHELDELRNAGQIAWEHSRYRARYAIDAPQLGAQLASGVPVLHIGQAAAIDALKSRFPAVRFHTVELRCERDEARSRLICRGSADLDERLRIWDSTPVLPGADLRIDTGALTPEVAAQSILADLVSASESCDKSPYGTASK